MIKQFDKLGQLFMVGLPGLDVDQSTEQLINDLGVNHFIIFKRNVESPAQLKDLCHKLKDACKKARLPAPLISIDQEGGSVARLPEPFTQFDDARKLAESPEPLAALSEYAAVCVKELSSVGINMNLSPVLDVCPAGEGFFMEKRSLGADPETVGQLACHIITGLQQGGVAACAKHFPGLGAAKLDPHLQLPIVSQTREQIDNVDLVPFQKAIAEDVASIMTSHTIYENLDATIPATLSQSILTGLLREKMGFEGVIITDDLEMGAIENEWSVAQASVQAFLAGADMLLICHDHDKVRQSYEKLAETVSEGGVGFSRYEESLDRVSNVRQKYA